MTHLAYQERYWDNVASEKVFAHPLDIPRLNTMIEKDAHILDYGCGQGRICQQLSEAGFKNIVGVDYSAEMIREAQSRHPALKFTKTEGYKLPYTDQTFDAVVLFAVLTCIPSDDAQRELISEITRVLRPDGILLVSDYLLQTDQRNLARYKEFESEFNSFGTFRLSDGGIVRHHHPDWFKELFTNYSILEAADIDSKTMNGNPVRVRQLWAKRKSHIF